MDLRIISLIVLAVFLAAYLFYRKALRKIFRIDDANITPATRINDGHDYVPAKPALLIGQHFSAIAAAGPILGPILAGLWFGWVPALLWIVLGAIFIGGIHDFSSLIASVRHRARSIGEIVKEYMTPGTYLLFLIFMWLALIYVIIAFTDITANTFKVVQEGEAYGPAVAVSSILYLTLGVVMGVCLHKFRMPLWLATSIFLPLVFFVVWVGQILPPGILNIFGGIPVKRWDIFLLCYCFVASIIPVWLLLQPRGYLGGCFLYGTMLASLIGLFFGGYSINFPAFRVEAFKSIVNAKPLFPLLFITVACGACSGFHAIVSSGTTSKQLRKESDAIPIGYGTMLLEGIVAFFALSTVMMLSADNPLLTKDPTQVYAAGIANFLKVLKINYHVALGFALLAFSTFVYDTLDVCTRLARYIFQELTGWHTKISNIVATLVTLLIPLAFLMVSQEKAYLVAWPIFGTSNQLLASLTLLAISVWLWRKGKNFLITIIPMFFMLVMTMWSLVLQIKPGFMTILKKGTISADAGIISIGAGILFVLAMLLVIEALNLYFRHKKV
ncbi:MAG: carbon starvation protein A [Candidatus Omnitrophica bacterium]|nr:carbon starvation protein A [Candidatus Omnitrophota bacterium]